MLLDFFGNIMWYLYGIFESDENRNIWKHSRTLKNSVLARGEKDMLLTH